MLADRGRPLGAAGGMARLGEIEKSVIGGLDAGGRDMDDPVPELERELASTHLLVDGAEKRAVVVRGEELRPVGHVIARAEEPAGQAHAGRAYFPVRRDDSTVNASVG